MAGFNRFDRVVIAVLLAVLVGLSGLAIANRSGAKSSSSPSASGNAVHVAGTPDPSLPSDPSDPPATTGAPPTTTAPATPTTTTNPAAVAGPVTAVGDSILIDMQPNLQADIPGIAVDGLVSRQFETGIGVVQADRAAGTLGSVLVVELGTNGTVTSADIDAMMQAAAGVKRVVFVNVDVPRSWEQSDNATLAAGVARYPGVAVLADWFSLSSPHPEWFTADQVHLQPAGAAALAGLIAQDV